MNDQFPNTEEQEQLRDGKTKVVSLFDVMKCLASTINNKRKGLVQ